MIWKGFVRGLIYLVLLLIACPSWAAHPLITDDTGTQRKGKFQLELNGQYDWDRDDSEGVFVKSTGGQAAATLSYGVADNVDLILNLPYLWGNTEVNETTVYDEKGIGDATFEVKWRLFEKTDSAWH